MSIESSPETGELKANSNRLIAVDAPMLLLAHDPIAKQVFNDFMWDYVGDPVIDKFPRLSRHYPEHGEIEYDQRSLKSYTQEGHLVHVRTNSRFTDSQPEHFLVVTADLSEGTITEWWAEKCIVKGYGNMLKTEVILGNQPPEQASEESEFSYTGEPVLDLLQSIKDAQVKRRAEMKKARLSLTSQGCWFKPIGEESLPLSAISELITKLNKYQAQ